MKKLVRDKVAGLLKEKGYKPKTEKLEGEQFKKELYSLFWQKFKASIQGGLRQVKANYAEMLEILRALMIKNGVDIKSLKPNENQPIKWYKNTASFEQKLANARTDLMQKFYELLDIKTEAIKDQLVDMFDDFTTLLEAHNVKFAQVEEERRRLNKNYGGYIDNKGKGVYLTGVSKIITIEHSA